MTMDIYSETINAKMGIVVNYAIDTANKMMDMQMIIDMLGMQIKTQSYYTDNVCYAQDPFTQEWHKKVYLPDEYEMLFRQQSNYEMIQFEDTLYAGLNQIESTDENEILLAGDVLLMDLYNSLVQQQSLSYGLDQKAVFETCSFEMTLDKNTCLIKNMLMIMKLKQSEVNEYGDDVDVTMDVVVNLDYSDYNGDFEIVVPEEVIEKAVDVDLGETRLQ